MIHNFSDLIFPEKMKFSTTTKNIMSFSIICWHWWLRASLKSPFQVSSIIKSGKFLRRKKKNNKILFLVSQSKLLSLMEAVNIIIRYIIKRFESPNAPIILLKALKSLCEADAGLENLQAYASIKYMKYPENSKANGSGSDKDSSPKSEVKRSRSELSIVIMQQLAQPLTGTVPLTNFSETQFDFTVRIFFK